MHILHLHIAMMLISNSPFDPMDGKEPLHHYFGIQGMCDYPGYHSLLSPSLPINPFIDQTEMEDQ